MSLTATGRRIEHSAENNLANYSAKRRVAKGNLKAKAAVLFKMFFYWCLILTWLNNIVLRFYNALVTASD